MSIRTYKDIILLLSINYSVKMLQLTKVHQFTTLCIQEYLNKLLST